MFGYVRPYKPELKVREYEMFRAAYCGLCWALKEKYGGLMLWIARDILRDPRDVDDAKQEAFVTIYKEISKKGTHKIKNGI